LLIKEVGVGREFPHVYSPHCSPYIS